MKSLISLIVLFCYFVYGLEAYSNLRKHHVYIYNEITQPGALIYHCSSADTDFGIKALLPGQSFHWNFRSNLMATTLYTCQFRWNPRLKDFVVFYARWDQTFNTFNYVVRDDGFYRGSDPNNHDANLDFLFSWD